MAGSRLNTKESSILVVEDVPENMQILLMILEELGCNLRVANNGEEALELAARHPPDLILLDVMMPGIDGFETCRRLKAMKNTKNIPVIFLSALTETESVVEGFDAGGVDYLTKPVRKEEVLLRVQLYLEKAWLERELEEKNRKLSEWNAELDKQVAARTAELSAKARELESRDRIMQKLLKVPNLYHSLNIILEGIAEALDLKAAVIYLTEADALKPAAAIGVSLPGELVRQDRLASITPSPAIREAIDRIGRQQQAIRTSPAAGFSEAALIPVMRDSTMLGLIEATGNKHFAEDEMLSLAGFALQTAVAIIDARVGKKAEQP